MNENAAARDFSRAVPSQPKGLGRAFWVLHRKTTEFCWAESVNWGSSTG